MPGGRLIGGGAPEKTSDREPTAFGSIDRVATPLRHYTVAPIKTRPIARAIAAYLARSGHEPLFIVHGFGKWVGAAVAATAELARRGIAAVPVARGVSGRARIHRVPLRASDGVRSGVRLGVGADPRPDRRSSAG